MSSPQLLYFWKKIGPEVQRDIASVTTKRSGSISGLMLFQLPLNLNCSTEQELTAQPYQRSLEEMLPERRSVAAKGLIRDIQRSRRAAA
ncbi:MAG TPA: hypothetical protein VI636_09600 [Candidatus Angelobacter sp.]